MLKKTYPLIPLLICSLSQTVVSQEMTTYIYNGTTTTTDTFPSIATLYYDAIEYSGLYGMYCGATILDSQHVMTAAHCLYDGDGELNEEYLVYTSVALQMEDESEFLDGDWYSTNVFRASEFYVHSGYVDSSSSTGTSWPNDIAIIKLDEEISTDVVDSDDYVERADSDESDEYRVDGEPFIAVGHGYTEDGDEDELLQTTLNYEPASDCDLGNISDSQLCMTGEYDEDTGYRNTTCYGDSGGPLYWDNGSEYVQAGITSYGWSGCYSEDSDDTSVFTEVADYESWISSVLAGNEEPDYSITDAERDAYEPDDYTYPDFSSREVSADDDNDSDDSSSDSGGSTEGVTLLLLASALVFRRRQR